MTKKCNERLDFLDSSGLESDFDACSAVGCTNQKHKHWSKMITILGHAEITEDLFISNGEENL